MIIYFHFIYRKELVGGVSTIAMATEKERAVVVAVRRQKLNVLQREEKVKRILLFLIRKIFQKMYIVINV